MAGEESEEEGKRLLPINGGSGAAENGAAVNAGAGGGEGKKEEAENAAELGGGTPVKEPSKLYNLSSSAFYR